MTFEDVMKRYSGTWEDGKAVIQAEGGYYWAIATGSPERYTLTSDGKRYVGSEAAPNVERQPRQPRQPRRVTAGE
jgi:hypothetical protein